MGSAIHEEVLFRGLIQSRLVEVYGAPLAIVCTASLFAVRHLDVEQGTCAFFIGRWLGWWAHRQRSIVIPIVAHAVNNLVVFTVARWFEG